MKTHFEIKNINLTAAMTDEVISEVPCGSCTLCCQKLSPYLTPEEIASGKYPISLVNPSQEQLNLNPNVGPLVVLYRKKEGGCGMFVDGKCSIYEDRPVACRQFDCRKGHHPSIPNMVN
jgi:Fe-S-cluster containining protein